MKLAGLLRRNQAHFLLALLALALARPTLTSSLAGSLPVVVGIGVRVWAAGFLRKGKELCCDGPYRYVRHPLYLGSAIAALGFSIMMNTICAWAVVFPLFLLLYLAQASSEERLLCEQYAETHAEWARQVPMLLPWPGRSAAGQGGRWRLHQLFANREHYHVLVTLALAALFYAKEYYY